MANVPVWLRTLATVVAWSVSALACAACTTSGETGGIWRGIAPIAGASNDLIYAEDGGSLAMEIVLGEYGPDLAGVIKFFRSDNYLRRRTAEPPDRACACALIHNGKVDAANGRAVFTLTSCLPGSSPKATVRSVVTLTLTATDLLVSLRVDDTHSALHNAVLDVQLQRQGGAGDISDPDLLCPAGSASGNPASGQ